MSRIKQQYSPRTPVRELWGDYIGATSIELPDRWDESQGDFTYEVFEAVQCESCGKWVSMHGDGEERHNAIDSDVECDGYLLSEGTMMSYGYPVNLRRVYNDPDRAALLIADLPLCLIYMNDDYYLALTGGGMDLSWEIAEAYMRLGHLPPAHFANLPRYAGMPLDNRRRWILRGMRASLQIQIRRASADLSRLRDLQKAMARK